MEQLFPDIDLSRFNGKADGLPAGEPAGVMAGLNSSLLSLLANFSPGDLGVCVVDEKLQLSLTIPDWTSWGWVEGQGAPTIAASSSDPVTIFTVPADERCWLEGAQVARNSGDNTFGFLYVVQPPGYTSGDGRFNLIQLITAATSIYWPCHEQVVSRCAGDTPLLLEPGATVLVTPSGAGVSETVASTNLFMRRSKIVRAMAP